MKRDKYDVIISEHSEEGNAVRTVKYPDFFTRKDIHIDEPAVRDQKLRR